ncbi:MAG: dihydropteroate synthase [Sedimentibacter sp.]|uniref:dihydropteroate synthase n=1 Tax=Sedimentibacter sp. TaxID=1960295 RepID=UPI003157FC65
MNTKDIKLIPQKRIMKFMDRELVLGERTLVMGILNVTPDSFSDGGDYTSVNIAVEHAKTMIREGADIIDIGGESSRPGHTRITAEEELSRVIPVIKRLSRETDAILSLDTIRSEVAEEAVKNGAHIINDIWGFHEDRKLADVAARYGTPVVLMHNHVGVEYDCDIMEAIKKFLMESVRIAKEAGVKDDMIILDPGLGGFGKTVEHNLEIMSRLGELRDLGYPVLIGTSRKSIIASILDVPPKDRDVGTSATTVLGVVQGMDIVRVHNVLINAQAAKVADAIIRRK